jgi:BlaI family transcriptional regulator, penicillinase repressor
VGRLNVDVKKILKLVKKFALRKSSYYICYENLRTMNMIRKYQPTTGELEILQVIWDKGSATVREVHDVLKESKDIGYTTALKTMQIMTAKGILKRDTSNRTHIYSPVVSMEKTRKQFLSRLVDGFFQGSTTNMVLGALDNKALSSSEIQEIKDYLDKIQKS